MGGVTAVKIDMERLAQLVARHPDATIKELRALLQIDCSESGVGVAMKRLGLTLKKTIHAAEQNRPDVAQRRHKWRREQKVNNAKRVIFIDETWAKANMTRIRGRAQRGQRLIAQTPHGHWNMTTLIAALGVEGICCSTLVDNAVNADVFEAFNEQVLVPELRHGDVVVMDNLSSHKRQRVGDLIESAGAQIVFLPP